jgi:hypothetical protein
MQPAVAASSGATEAVCRRVIVFDGTHTNFIHKKKPKQLDCLGFCVAVGQGLIRAPLPLARSPFGRLRFAATSKLRLGRSLSNPCGVLIR